MLRLWSDLNSKLLGFRCLGNIGKREAGVWEFFSKTWIQVGGPKHNVASFAGESFPGQDLSYNQKHDEGPIAMAETQLFLEECFLQA